MAVTYEWVVEQTQGDGDIADTSGFDSLEEAQSFQTDPDLTKVICLRRDVGNPADGLTDRQYAYPGATAFEYGAAIPVRLLAQLTSLLEKSK